MLKLVNAILIAAAIAATATMFTGPGAQVVASGLPKADEAAIEACARRPWPYLNCVGTRYGNPRVRLVTVERLPQ